MDKVVYFTGCFSNYYDPEIAKSFVTVMEINEIEVLVPEQVCCGMPIMANANYKGAKRNFEKIVRSLFKASEGKYPIVTTCPSCNMMLKKEGKTFFPSAEANYVSSMIYDSSEFVMNLDLKRKLNRFFGRLELKVLYHNPCHLKVQNIDATIYVLKLIPGIEVIGINRDCCGLGGSFGMKRKNYPISYAIGTKIWRMVEELKPDAVVTECGGCGLQISSKRPVKIYHPMVLLNMAYSAASHEAA
ncbi:MAG: heterodisulfide reductase-related iron-sulfur binding cluster [Desulfobacterota bacterium]|nr:heterodisulfide reductase-related iron-sulfur binding cluster [Thermodesulfobacteriota bacterium]MDW8001200.1 heterodisulfide reductase-related iron-sulfur binding cluster [Deltaproteobacteria bacterium]